MLTRDDKLYDMALRYLVLNATVGNILYYRATNSFKIYLFCVYLETSYKIKSLYLQQLTMCHI